MTVRGLAVRGVQALPGPLKRAVMVAHFRRRLARWSAADMPDLAPLPALLTPGDRAFDIGAHVGWVSTVLAEVVGPTGWVDAVEPVPETAAVAAACLRHRPQVRVHPVGVSSAVGPKPFAMVKGPQAHYEGRVVAGAGAATRTLPMTTLDTLRAEVAWPVGFVKLDVEGHEGPALDGARDLLTRDQPAWLIEVTTPGIAARLARAGYTAYVVEAGRLVPQTRPRQAANYWFLTPAHLGRLRAAGWAV